MRAWMAAIGAGALLSGIILYLFTVFAVPTVDAWPFGSVPRDCLLGSSQACADAQARLTVFRQIQPLAWLIAGVGALLLTVGLATAPVPPPRRP